jgi:hypothetical protein
MSIEQIERKIKQRKAAILKAAAEERQLKPQLPVTPPNRATAAAAAAAASFVLAPAQPRRCQQPSRHPLLSEPSACPVPQTEMDRFWAQIAASTARNTEFRLDLRVSLLLSRPGEPVQFGMFIARLGADSSRLPSAVICPAGTLVTPYGGLLRHRLDIEQTAATLGLSLQEAKSHARRVPGHDYACDGLPLAWMLRRPIPRDMSELHALSSADVAELLPATPLFTAAEVALFHRSPLGFMCNTACTAAGQRNNVRVEYRPCSIGGGLLLYLPLLIATEDLCEGNELLSPYRNQDGRRV